MTISAKARRLLRQACCGRPAAADNICDIIDADSGSPSTQDTITLGHALTDMALASNIVNQITAGGGTVSEGAAEALAIAMGNRVAADEITTAILNNTTA